MKPASHILFAPLALLLIVLGSCSPGGAVAITGELQQWHKVTLTFDGPAAAEADTDPNPFTDYRMTVAFTHESGEPSHEVPGYFAADGDAGETSAEAGNKWRVHVSPDKPGVWTYAVSFVKGKNVALDASAAGDTVSPDGQTGEFTIAPTDKQAPDFRAQGRLSYVGKHHLQFAGTGEYFLKAGPDAPETFLAYTEFDGTEARKENVPLKTWQPHAADWQTGDPTWKDGKGKGIIGALNYLGGKGVNAFSFLTYNTGGDGDNVWPFIAHDAKLHYDVSKLDQWAVVFDHAQSRGIYLHFKMQENEIDDHRQGMKREPAEIAPALDGGQLGPERKLYCRELIARFGYVLALNWNLGEENTQSTEELVDMAGYIRDTDPYDHHIVVHTFPPQQDAVYTPLLGPGNAFTGTSLQNSWENAHQRVLKWRRESANAGKRWVVASDEQNPASQGVPPDPGYEGFDGTDREGKPVHTIHDVRKYTLWGNLMAGGAGVEYYFGYQLPQNDLIAEDFRSRDQSWDYCRLALGFFRVNQIPFWEMENANALIGNVADDNSKFCFAKPGEVYVVYLPNGGTTSLNLSGADGEFDVKWFNPRVGGSLQNGAVTTVKGGANVRLGAAPSERSEDWVVLVRR